MIPFAGTGSASHVLSPHHRRWTKSSKQVKKLSFRWPFPESPLPEPLHPHAEKNMPGCDPNYRRRRSYPGCQRTLRTLEAWYTRNSIRSCSRLSISRLRVGGLYPLGPFQSRPDRNNCPRIAHTLVRFSIHIDISKNDSSGGPQTPPAHLSGRKHLLLERNRRNLIQQCQCFLFDRAKIFP